MNLIKKLIANESGATAIEYALIAALITIASVTAMKSLGTNVSAKFQKVSDELK
jgi:pilus assembly protein Flp/PilA